MRNRAWEYVFFIDLEGHQADKDVKAAIDELEGLASYLKVLGQLSDGVSFMSVEEAVRCTDRITKCYG